MADNTIANAIKFLKGEEKSLPAAKTEGQVYFAYKNVGTAEKPSYTGAIYIDTPIGGTQNRIKMTANADIADKAFNDSAGLSIRDTYLSSLGYTDDGKQTILIKGSGNNQTRIALPIASTTKSGIVTTDAQSFGGAKTFTTINSTNLTITGTSGFNYTGIETATGDKARPVWFAYDGINGKPVVNTNFTYNPATQTLKVANLSGTADKAIKDSAGNDIRNTYIKNITVNNDIMTITKGSGATSALSIKDKLYSGTMMATKEDLDKFIETNVFKFGHINAIEGYNGLEKNDGIILSASWKSNTNSAHQIFIDDSGYALRHRYRNDGIWSDWASILDSTNYNSYAPTKAGSGAYGTWDINILGNAASANRLNTNAGSATFPVYFSNGVPVACSTNLAVNITGNAASATKLTSNAGSAIQPIYFKDGKPVTTTYSLNATVKAGTSNRVAFYSGNNEISSASSLKYYTATNSKKANQTILRIWGTTYGNDATTMISGKASSLSWNDGGPQIQFSTSEAGSQDGALIFTDHDSAGVGASFHFVSNQSEWSVVSKRFVAKTSVIIGQENHTVNNQGYNLYVNGTEYINGILTAVGDCAFIAHNKEFNFVPTLKASTSIWFNYRQTGGQPTNNNFIINEYVFGNGANKALASIKDGLFSGAATYVRDSNNNTNNISITYSKAAQASTSWLASWNGYELGSISPSNITAGKATKLATARTITLSGAVTGSVSFDGSANVTLTTSVNHTHSQYYDSNISRTKNTVLAAPNGTDGKAIFRSLVAADIPSLTKSKISDFPTSMPASDVYAWAKASTKPSYTKAEIGLGNVDNTADSQKSVKYATTSGSATTTTKLQTYKQGSITETYGTQYPLYAQWEDSSNLRLKVDNYTVKVNYADKAGSASSATNAATATRLQTARTISLTGSVTGSGTFDGSGNLSITTSTNHSHSQYLPLAGGTMNGTSFITWADSRNWDNNNNNVTFPVTRGGLQWYGQSDSVKLFSQETASDNLELVLQFEDDNSNGLSIRDCTGTQTARITAEGKITASSFIGNLNGNASTATALTSSAGSSTQPIYFSGGKPVACTYTLNKSVPADAKFTDTNTWRPLGTTGDTACAGNDSRLSNARPASDVYAWAKASSKPSYSWDEITNKPSSFNPSSHTHPYLQLAGGTMKGTINFNGDTLACNFRSNASGYCTGIMHQTNGNEALMFAAANAVTSFIFKCGQNPVGMTSTTWTGITPSMQIKKQSVYINSLIANNVTPGYNLYINGTTRCNGTLGVGNGSSAEIDFFPNSSSTIGARIKAYNDRIEFVFS